MSEKESEFIDRYGHAQGVLNLLRRVKRTSPEEWRAKGTSYEDFLQRQTKGVIKELSSGLLPLSTFDEIVDPNDPYDEDPNRRLGGWRE